MADVHAIAQELCGDDIFMLDLAIASRQITGKFDATEVLFSEIEFVYDDDKKCVEQNQSWEFALPVRDNFFDDENSNDVTPKNPRTQKRSRHLRERMLEYAAKYLHCYVDENFRRTDPTARDMFSTKHFVKFDEQQRIWIHFLSFSKLNGQKTGGIHKIMAIMEGDGDQERPILRNWRDLNGDRNIAKIKSKFYEYVNFMENDIITGLHRGGGFIEEFIILKSFFDKKLKSMSFVSNDVIKSSWQTMLATGKRNTNLPWEITSADSDEPGSNVLTATVSLDLRKSTSMMEQVEDQHLYAIWLEALSEICREITLHNCGIFDKFTGDGIIAHFVCLDGNSLLPRDCQAEEIIRHAFTCACELVRAVGIHHEDIKPYLRFNIGASGVAVGMAIDNAAWSLDRDGRPIVVGKGVVNACRLNNGLPGTIRLAYNMRRHLKGTVQDDAFEVKQVEDHKELNDSLLPECYLSCGPQVRLGRDDNALKRLVDKLAKEVRSRHELRRDRRRDT